MALSRPGKFRAADISVGSLVRFEDADVDGRAFPHKYEARVDEVSRNSIHVTVMHVWTRDRGGEIIGAEEVGAKITIDEANVLDLQPAQT